MAKIFGASEHFFFFQFLYSMILEENLRRAIFFCVFAALLLLAKSGVKPEMA